MQVVQGGDWSIGLNTDSALADVQLLMRLGEGLRRAYADVLEKPLPEDWTAALERLEERSDETRKAAEGPASDVRPNRP